MRAVVALLAAGLALSAPGPGASAELAPISAERISITPPGTPSATPSESWRLFAAPLGAAETTPLPPLAYMQLDALDTRASIVAPRGAPEARDYAGFMLAIHHGLSVEPRAVPLDDMRDMCRFNDPFTGGKDPLREESLTIAPIPPSVLIGLTGLLAAASSAWMHRRRS